MSAQMRRGTIVLVKYPCASICPALTTANARRATLETDSVAWTLTNVKWIRTFAGIIR